MRISTEKRLKLHDELGRIGSALGELRHFAHKLFLETDRPRTRGLLQRIDNMAAAFQSDVLIEGRIVETEGGER